MAGVGRLGSPDRREFSPQFGRLSESFHFLHTLQCGY